jgi:hypothetical protein
MSWHNCQFNNLYRQNLDLPYIQGTSADRADMLLRLHFLADPPDLEVLMVLAHENKHMVNKPASTNNHGRS